MDARIGSKFLYAGAGYGGSCFPKDVRAVMATAREAGMTLEIIDAVHRVNERQKVALADRLVAYLGERARGATVAVWGLAFKPGTDDLRESPALVLVERLLAEGINVRAHDPVAMDAARARYGTRVTFCEDAYEAARGAHAVALMTEWHEYRFPDLHRLKALLADAVAFDGRNAWEPATLRAAGFYYRGVGRPVA